MRSALPIVCVFTLLFFSGQSPLNAQKTFLKLLDTSEHCNGGVASQKARLSFQIEQFVTSTVEKGAEEATEKHPSDAQAIIKQSLDVRFEEADASLLAGCFDLAEEGYGAILKLYTKSSDEPVRVRANLGMELVLAERADDDGFADIRKSAAGKFVEAAHLRFYPLILEVKSRATILMSSIEEGSCQTPELISFESSVNDLEEFRVSSNISFAESFATSHPAVKAAVTKIMAKFYEVGERSVALLKTQTAEVALSVNCLDLADRYFHDVLSLQAQDTDIRKARIGIENVQLKGRFNFDAIFGQKRPPD